MQIYVSRHGEKLGPFSIFRVIDMLRGGEVGPEDLSWHAGLDQWVPLKDLPAMEDTVRQLTREKVRKAEEKKAQAIPDAPRTKDADAGDVPPPPPSTFSRRPATTGVPRIVQVHPARRFWARTFDYLFILVVVWLVIGAPKFPEPADGVSYWEQINRFMNESRGDAMKLAYSQLLAPVLWIFIEALLIAQFQTTPGKLLFGIRVVSTNGESLSYKHSFLRAAGVWVFGMGLCFPIVTLFVMAFSFFRLLSTGTTLWDQKLETRPEFSLFGMSRVAIAVAVFVFLYLFQQYLIQS